MKKFIKISNKRAKTYLLTMTMVLALLASCKKNLDINADPNNPTDVPVSALLPTAEVGLGFFLGGDGSRIPGSFVQYYAGHRGQPLLYGQYNVNPSQTDNFWSNMYTVTLSDLKSIIDKSNADGNQAYAGVAQILTAFTFSVLTDMYGDIPFSQALQNSGNISPAYDKQQDIYPALLALIDQGIANIQANGGTIRPGSDDVIYKGDLTKWVKFGNSLKLRLNNHLSKVQPGAAAAFLATNPDLISSNSETAQVVFGTTPATANPIYQFDVLSGRSDMAVSNTIVDRMKALSDPRIPVYFNPVVNNGAGLQGQILGNVPGGDNDDSGQNLFSREGSAYASINSPVVLMSAAEVQYIIAEVQFRAGNSAAASTAYNAAIDLDFSSLGLSSAAYKAQPAVAFNNTLQQIMEQKWITMYQAPWEAWVDWRRTGFPVLVPAATNRTGGIIPRKLAYPQLEVNLNAASLQAGPGIVPYLDDLKRRVFWDTP
ncbi:MAG TPA: SusD/RagB family nutrient-binding outer membrane lipoprotein [Daejeonella sp.]|nr:SusD/RagB family nutrient-binding outer membrane lipoprotein [Daejeonella sp.]